MKSEPLKVDLDSVAHSIVSCDDRLVTRMGPIFFEHWPPGIRLGDEHISEPEDAISYRAPGGTFSVKKEAGYGELITVTMSGGFAFYLRWVNSCIFRVFPDLPGSGPGHSNLHSGVMSHKPIEAWLAKFIPATEHQLSNGLVELLPDGGVRCRERPYAVGQEIDIQLPDMCVAREANSGFVAVDLTHRETWESVQYWERHAAQDVDWYFWDGTRWLKAVYRGPPPWQESLEDAVGAVFVAIAITFVIEWFVLR
jgi:hypothetical protein